MFGSSHGVPVRRLVCFSAMFPRVSAVLPFRPLSRLPLCSGGPEASAAAIVLRGAPHGTLRYRVSFSAAGPAGLQATPVPTPVRAVVILRLPGVDVRSHCFKSEEREIPERENDLPKVIVSVGNRAKFTCLACCPVLLLRYHASSLLLLLPHFIQAPEAKLFFFFFAVVLFCFFVCLTRL